MNEGRDLFQLFFFLIHCAGFIAACALYRDAPCWMQKLTIVGVAIAMLVIAVANLMTLAGIWWAWWAAVLGMAFEHLAILLWLFRLHWHAKMPWIHSQQYHSS